MAPVTNDNPFATSDTPGFGRILGSPLTLENVGRRKNSLLLPLDANLGVEGLPQSATGQTALFTGVNAARELGHHATGLPGPVTRSIIEKGSLFSWAKEIGHSAIFANAYTPAYLDAVRDGRRRPSVTTAAVVAAGLKTRDLSDLERGQAASWDIVRDHFSRQLGRELPVVTAQEVGRHLAAIAADHDVTVFESFITDLTGHLRSGFDSDDTLARVDGLLEGLFDAISAGTTVVVTSDHGNFEATDHR